MKDLTSLNIYLYIENTRLSVGGLSNNRYTNQNVIETLFLLIQA